MAGFVGSFGDLAAVKIRHKRAVSGFGEPVGGLLDLLVEPPPLLDADKSVRAHSYFGCCHIARASLSIRPLELNHFTHEALRDLVFKRYVMTNALPFA